MSKTAQRKVTAERDGHRDALAQRKPQHTTDRNYPFLADYRRGYRKGLKQMKLQQEDVKIVDYVNIEDAPPPISVEQALLNLQQFGISNTLSPAPMSEIFPETTTIMDGDWSYPQEAA